MHRNLCRRFDACCIFVNRGTIESGYVFPDRLRVSVAECKAHLALIGPDWLDDKNAKGRCRLKEPSDSVTGIPAHRGKLSKDAEGVARCRTPRSRQGCGMSDDIGPGALLHPDDKTLQAPCHHLEESIGGTSAGLAEHGETKARVACRPSQGPVSHLPVFDYGSLAQPPRHARAIQWRPPGCAPLLFSFRQARQVKQHLSLPQIPVKLYAFLLRSDTSSLTDCDVNCVLGRKG